MKKLTSLFLVFVLILTGCSNRSSSNDVESSTTTGTQIVLLVDEEPSSETTTISGTTKSTTTKKQTSKVTTIVLKAKTSTLKSTTTTSTTRISTSKFTTTKATTTVKTAIKKSTTTEKTATKKTTEKKTETTKLQENNKSKRLVLPVKNIQQLPELPAGCEITSTTIVLNYYGFKCDKVEMAHNYLPTMKYPDKNGYWKTPWETFVGDPEKTYYGCYSPVIYKTINKYFEKNQITGYEVNDLTGTHFKDLYKEIDDGNPVIIWASVNMVDINRNLIRWKVKKNTVFRWTSNEHCLVLIGYDLKKDTVILSDPFDPRGTVEYPRSVVEKIYKQLEQQALVIHKVR